MRTRTTAKPPWAAQCDRPAPTSAPISAVHLSTTRAFMPRAFMLLLLLALSTAAALRIPPATQRSRWSRRAILAAATAWAAATAAAAIAPDDWGLTPELDKTNAAANYLDNAEKFASHLVWAAELKPGVVDADAGEQLKAEIQSFAALYRKDTYTNYAVGSLPGFTSLQTAYDALSAHNARYGPCKVAVPEQLEGTIKRNVKDACKQILIARRRIAAAAEQ